MQSNGRKRPSSTSGCWSKGAAGEIPAVFCGQSPLTGVDTRCGIQPATEGITASMTIISNLMYTWDLAKSKILSQVVSSFHAETTTFCTTMFQQYQNSMESLVDMNQKNLHDDRVGGNSLRSVCYADWPGIELDLRQSAAWLIAHGGFAWSVSRCGPTSSHPCCC